MGAVITALTLLGMLAGLTQFSKENKYLRHEWHRVKDSIENEMIIREGKVNKKQLRYLTDSLHQKALKKVGYIRTDKFEPSL